ncbi:hypothetical protein C3420_08090 [Acinetobacter sp. ACNIH3]|jgi:hypothetical protein|nr:hypothetical protein C3420_08090 [Acinetobacter sp. ACNIH3]POV78582.1 hypothetical protein C3421_07375 [Acinetobacter sp. ACNIH4]
MREILFIVSDATIFDLKPGFELICRSERDRKDIPTRFCIKNQKGSPGFLSKYFFNLNNTV